MPEEGWHNNIRIPESLQEALEKHFPGGYVVAGFRANGQSVVSMGNPQGYAALHSLKLKAMETIEIWDKCAGG